MQCSHEINATLIDEGRGDPSIFFVHGFLCAPDDWLHQIDYFSAFNRTIAPTLRGHNGSPRGSEGLSIPRLANDCVSIINDLGLKKTVLVGHSMGTRIVFEIARLINDDIAGIVLIDGGRISQSEEDKRQLDNFDAVARNGEYESFIRETFSAMVSNPDFEQLRNKQVRRTLSVPQEWAVELRCNTIKYDSDTIEQSIRQAHMPLLVIQSTDKIGNRIYQPLKENDIAEYPSFIGAYSSHSDTVILSGVGHFSPLEAPDRINASIKAWMERCQIG